MKAKEKAEELLNKMYQATPSGSANENMKTAKQCALVCIDEIIKAIDWHDYETPNKEFEYWNEVKTEIENL